MGRKVKDLTDNTYGDLRVLYKSSEYAEHPVRWMTLCSCGKKREFPGNRLKKGNATHCGCKSSENYRSIHLHDITGNKYHSLTVLKYMCTKRGGQSIWLVQCDCGNTFETAAGNLKKGHVQRCESCRPEAKSLARTKDETGKVYGQITVLHKSFSRGGEIYWMCRCSCGKEYNVRGSHLRGGVQRCRKCVGLLRRVANPISGYPPEFSLSLRTKVRKRDKYVCQYCQIKFGIGQLDVHHIDHDRYNNGMDNLVSLCNKCHYKMHTKKSKDWIPYWKDYMARSYFSTL